MVRTNKTARYPPPTILPAVRSDIPSIIDVWLAAKAPDLLYLNVSLPDDEQAERWARDLNRFFDDPLISIIKAVDWNDENRVTAVAIWMKKNYAKGEGEKELGRGNLEVMWTGGLLIDGKVKEEGEEKRTPLEDYIRTRQMNFNAAWTDKTKHIELALLMTDPLFQRRGIGTALLRWGHAIADEEEVPCFLCASPFGWPLYRALGWNHVGEEMVIDLKEFVKGAEGGDMGWGVYKMRFMARMARAGK